MSATGKFETAFLAAHKLHQGGNLADAEKAYRQLSTDYEGVDQERALRSLVNLYLQSARSQEAVDVLIELTHTSPENVGYFWDLATLLQSIGEPDESLSHYQRLLALKPDSASAWFNFAMLNKRVYRYGDALRAYEKSIELGIDKVQEVYSNIGVLYADMRKVAEAKSMYDKALSVDDAYVPALYNLAMLYEETGERERAQETYRRILEIDPQHWDSIARLAETSKPADQEDPLFGELRAAIEKSDDEPLAQEALYFALGRILDGTDQYEEAFNAYSAGNALSKRRNRPYNRRITRQAFDQLVDLFSAEWIDEHSTDSKASPIFVCGMFRSGSTLTEQMLGAHPEITSGGELEFLPWLIARDLSPYPQQVADTATSDLLRIGDEYLSKTAELYPDAPNVTDKRPDNFLHLGLLKAMFPRARFVYTKRNCIDNCLSVYFQQIGGNLSYASDLHDSADYYAQHERLMRHWMSCFGDSIFTIDYDELVRAPEPQLQGLLGFLGIEWDDRCLAMEPSGGLVKTASLWQVREGLHTASSGRWQNYRNIVPGLESLCDQASA